MHKNKKRGMTVHVFETADLVRSPGIEPGTPTWKEGVLPLNYDRVQCVAELHQTAEWVKPWLGPVILKSFLRKAEGNGIATPDGVLLLGRAWLS